MCEATFLHAHDRNNVCDPHTRHIQSQIDIYERRLEKNQVLRLRLKDKHAKLLGDLAREVNFVWNYCNELQITMFNRERRFLSGYDFAKFTRGATKEGLHLCAQTVQAIEIPTL